MNPNNTSSDLTKFRLLWLLLGFVAVAFSLYTIVSAVITARTTGVLRLSSSNPKASLVISQDKTQAAAVGVGSAGLRLKPGVYQVSASDNGYQTTAYVQIQKKHTSKVVLNLITTKSAPSGGLYAINLQNTSELNNLLLSEQFTDVIQTTNDYIVNHVNPNTQSATITKTTLDQDGSINYTVETNTKPEKQFTVLLQKQPDGILIFDVSGTNFSITLNPY